MDIGRIVFGPRTDINQIISESGPRNVWPWPKREDVIVTSEPEEQAKPAIEFGEPIPIQPPVFRLGSVYVRYLEQLNGMPTPHVRDVEVRGHFTGRGRLTEFHGSEVTFKLSHSEERQLMELMQAAADRYIASLAAHLFNDPEGE